MTHSFPTRRSSDLLTAFLGDKGTTAAELERTINSNVRALPGSFETSGDVLGGIRSIVKFDRRSEEHTSELQSLMRSSYAVFCLKKKINKYKTKQTLTEQSN